MERGQSRWICLECPNGCWYTPFSNHGKAKWYMDIVYWRLSDIINYVCLNAFLYIYMYMRNNNISNNNCYYYVYYIYNCNNKNIINNNNNKQTTHNNINNNGNNRNNNTYIVITYVHI